MIQTSPLLIVPSDCEFVVGRLIKHLASGGFRAERSFDLRRARAVYTACTCPHHGTVNCNCQMIVLLVYFPRGGVHTLVAHGRDGITHLNWSEDLPAAEETALTTIVNDVFAEVKRSSKFEIPTGI
jgi:hypothetical protein